MSPQSIYYSLNVTPKLFLMIIVLMCYFCNCNQCINVYLTSASSPCGPRRPPREAPADVSHLSPPAARGQPGGCGRCSGHAGLLQETVHAGCRSGREADQSSCSTGTIRRTGMNFDGGNKAAELISSHYNVLNVTRITLQNYLREDTSTPLRFGITR